MGSRMKLLLTSDGLSTPRLRREFIRLFGRPLGACRVLVLFAERDPGYLRYVHATGMEFERAGILLPNMEFSDLSGKKSPSLKGFDVIYVCGGNTYFILDRIRKTGLAQKIKKFVASGGIYLGASAGSIIAGVDITIAGWGSTADSNEIGLRDLGGLRLARISVLSLIHI